MIFWCARDAYTIVPGATPVRESAAKGTVGRAVGGIFGDNDERPLAGRPKGRHSDFLLSVLRFSFSARATNILIARTAYSSSTRPKRDLSKTNSRLSISAKTNTSTCDPFCVARRRRF